MSRAPAYRPIHRPRGAIIAALDVGSSKLCCLIGRVAEGGRLHVIGFNQQKARGLKAGAVVDLDQATAAIGNTVHTAEQMAGETLKCVVVGLAGADLHSRLISVETGLDGDQVAESDVQAVMDRAWLPQQLNGHAADFTTVQASPIGFALDGRNGIKAPVGLYGQSLKARVHLLSATQATARNLTTCIERNHLKVEGFGAAPLAAGIATLTPDERELGALVIDLGADTTDMAVFTEGEAVHVDHVPIGGRHVTSDIARGLTTSLTHAERLKTLHGAAVAGSIDESEIIEAPQVGEDPTHVLEVPRSILVGIIRPRLEEIFEHVRAQLEDSGWARASGRRVVLTGGGASLHGIRELAQAILDKQVRIGRPTRLHGLPELMTGAAFAVPVGLLRFAHEQLMVPTQPQAAEEAGWLARMGHWLRDNF